MSFILDALKKSEAERQLGEVPSLQSGSPVPTPQQRSRSWLLPMFGVFLVAIIFALFWNQPHTSKVEPSLNQPLAINVASGPKSRVKQTQPQSKLSSTEQSPLTDYTPPVVLPTDIEGIDLATDAEPSPNSHNAMQNSTPSEDAPATSVAASVSEEQRVARLQKQRADELAEDKALVAAVEQRLASERAAKAELEQQPAVQKSRLSTVNLNELPASVRTQIPEINITMQVYSDDPAARFAIINGKRYKQTDQVADALILEEILRQGIILKFRQYFILVH